MINDSRKTSVIQVMDYTAPYKGNFICSLINLEEHLNKDNIYMIFVFSNKAKELMWVKELQKSSDSKNNRKIYFLSNSVLTNIKIINKIIRDNNSFIIHSHFCLPKTQLAVKLASKLNRHIKLVQHFHNHYKLPDGILKKYLFKYIFYGDLNIGCSESVTKSIICNERKKICIENAIYFPRLDNYEKVNLKELNIKEDNIVILMFGFDYVRKGVDIAIKALEPIAKKYNIILAISISIGKEKIEENIKSDLGYMPNWIRILPPRNDISSYYHISNIFLSSSREEGLCYSVIEAAYCGVTCICSDISGHPLDVPYIEKFRKCNSGELTKKIENVLSLNKDYLEEKSRETKKYIINKYIIDKWSENIISAYKNLQQWKMII